MSRAANRAVDPLERLPLRLHIDRLRLEGTAAQALGPVMEKELAQRIEERLAQIVSAHGDAALAVVGPLRLDGVTIRLEAGTSGEGVVEAIARQLYEQIYGPLNPWWGARQPALGPTPSPSRSATDPDTDPDSDHEDEP